MRIGRELFGATHHTNTALTKGNKIIITSTKQPHFFSLILKKDQEWDEKICMIFMHNKEKYGQLYKFQMT